MLVVTENSDGHTYRSSPVFHFLKNGIFNVPLGDALPLRSIVMPYTHSMQMMKCIR